MNASLIKNWNDVVTDIDTVYVLGDVFLGSHWSELQGIMKRLKGTKILILGNHDHLTPWQYIDCGFQSAHTFLQVELYNGKTFNLIHDPSAACVSSEVNPHRWLVGHIHGLFKDIDKRVINVGVDVRNFTPISEEEIIKEYK